MLNFWTLQQVEILKNEYGKHNPKELSKILNRTMGAINSKANKLGLKQPIIWDKDKTFLLIKEYPTTNLINLAEKLGVSFNALCTKAGLLKLKRSKIADGRNKGQRTCEIDDTQFDKIDSDFKSHFMGWVWSDGCLYKNSITIHLCGIDKEILDFFNLKICNGQKKLSICPPQTSIFKNGKICHSKEGVVFRITNKHIADKFREMGLIEDKSHKIEFPKINPELHGSFVRGFWEGDGFCSYGEKKSTRRAGVASCSKNFIESIGIILTKQNIHYTISFKDNSIYHLTMSSLVDLYKFYNFIYAGAEFRLSRKYIKLRNMINLGIKNTTASKEKYVIIDRRNNKWKVVIKKKSFGSFKTEAEAIARKREVSDDRPLPPLEF